MVFRSLGKGVHKNGVRNCVCIDDVGSILKFRMSFPFGEFCSVLQVRAASGVDTESPYRVRVVDRGLIAATLFGATVSDSQRYDSG